MNLVPIPFSSPLYPLPADYASLAIEGQRLARANGCRQWAIYDADPDIRAHRLIHATRFFDLYYLHPDPAADFDPLFYDMPPLPTPSMHWDLSRMWASSRFNAAIAPRGSAKSSHMRKDMILRICSMPLYSFCYATSTHENTKFTAQIVRDQAYANSRIQDDFALDFGGSFKPTRGDKPTGTESFFLNNGSWVRCVSAESRLRGIRPRRFRLDDPEYDERASTSMSVVRQYMDNLLFKIAIPMTLRADCGIDWVGTFVSKRHFLYHAMSVSETPDGLRAVDPRFDRWARLFIDACYEDKEGRLQSCWPEMWPASIEEKLRLNMPSSVSLEEMREIMGVNAFNAEMRGRPGSSEDQYLKIDPSPRGPHAYWFEGADELLYSDPLNTKSLICYTDPDGSQVRTPLVDFLKNARTFITVDTAYTENASSDRRCCGLLAVTPKNQLFLLDLWSDRKTDQVLIDQAFGMAQRWRCPLIAVEVVKESFKLYARFRSTVQTRLTQDIGLTHVPAIRDIRPGTMSKTAKIESLDVRFTHNLIKLPMYRRREAPWWARLFDQIESFNPEAPNGGLEHDDETDCLIASTPVLTRAGWKNISSITTDDEVLTRFGWRRVLRAWCTGRKGIVTRFGLTGTPNHRVWTENRGWVPLQDLVLDDIVMTCNQTCSSSTPNSHDPATLENGLTNQEKPFSSMGSGTTDIPSTSGGTFGSTSGHTLSTKSLRSLSISPFSPTTTDLSQQGSTSTTKMETPSTTPRKTSKPLIEKPTNAFIRRCVDALAAVQSNWNFLRNAGRRWSRRSFSASSVGLPILGFNEVRTSSVPVNAGAKQGLSDSEKKGESKPPQGPARGGQKIQPLQEPPWLDIGQSKEADTWNLTVEEHPEFFAGGLLVHNCLAMSLFVLKSRLKERPAAEAVKPINPVEHAKAGHFTLPGGASTLSLVPLSMISPEDLEHLLSAKHRPQGPMTKV